MLLATGHFCRQALQQFEKLNLMIDAKHFLRQHDGSWTTGVRFDDSGELGELVLRATTASVHPKHVAAGVEIARRWSEIRRALTPALWAFYLRAESWSTEYGPRVDASDDVWKQLTLSEVEVLLDEQGNVVRLHGRGRCEWEAEHGLELVVSGDGIPLYVGVYQGWTPKGGDDSSDWNFARKAVQDEVFAESRREDDDRDSSDAEPESEPAQGQHSSSPQQKSWWKFWW